MAIDQLRLTDPGGIAIPRSADSGSLIGRLGLLRPAASNAESASTFIVSENYFSVLGVPALQRRFSGDPAVLGKSIRLNGAVFTIAGITPHNFVGSSGRSSHTAFEDLIALHENSRLTESSS
jgi:hypothetical protein